MTAVAVANTTPAEAWLNQLRGAGLTLSPVDHDLGEGPLGTVREIVVTVNNEAEQDARILGIGVTCDCVKVEGLPMLVSAKSRGVIKISMEFKGSEGRFSREFELFTDQAKWQTLTGRITGKVIQNP